jgi:hypothetical protein
MRKTWSSRILGCGVATKEAVNIIERGGEGGRGRGDDIIRLKNSKDILFKAWLTKELLF